MNINEYAPPNRDRDDVSAHLADIAQQSEAFEASDDRRARRLARVLERDASTFTGILVEAAERRVAVTLDMLGNISLCGQITAVGEDCVIVTDAITSERSLVRSSAVRAVRTINSFDLTGDRNADMSASFQGLLEDLGALNEFVTVTCVDGSSCAGQLNWVGQDIAQLAVGRRGSPSHAYLPTWSISIVATR